MKKKNRRVLLLMAAACLIGSGVSSYAADDGCGTNYVNLLSASSIRLGGETRSQWPTAYGSIGGTERSISGPSDEVIWGPVMAWSGELQSAQMQVNAGTADVLVVRALWNDAWGSCATVNTLRVTASGVEDTSWSSSWVSNDYRIGIVITNTESAGELWWSVTYTKE
ncbi:MAG: hypothetical protein PHP44_10140 [Kiritimatiellae bacterium]|nr:hypothetical protein [Kiritimatiellia bacterium]MDD4736448.1 hypothetical protein [Kiritimatiellia bacterium]